MEAFLTILFMIIVGAIIGGVTNSLAIKMLFRPYNPIYIRNWRLPFTPGLIPKTAKGFSRSIRKISCKLFTNARKFSKKA